MYNGSATVDYQKIHHGIEGIVFLSILIKSTPILLTIFCKVPPYLIVYLAA